MIQFAPRRDDDFVAIAPLTHVENGVGRHLVAHANAARAHDAPFGIVDNRVAENGRLGLVDRLLRHALRATLMFEPVVLKITLASLVADRAIDGMIQEQQFLHGVTRLPNVFTRISLDLHAVGTGHLAGGKQETYVKNEKIQDVFILDGFKQNGFICLRLVAP